MALILKVISHLAVPQSFSACVNRKNMTIGRSENNTLVLADPDKYVSSRHATIEYRAPYYVITDTSANGVFVNQDPMRLGKGNSVELADGDQLTIGDYLISISITEDSDNASDIPVADPFPELAGAEAPEEIPSAVPTRNAADIDNALSGRPITTTEQGNGGLRLPPKSNNDPLTDSHAIEPIDSKGLAVDAPPSRQEKTFPDNQPIDAEKVDETNPLGGVLMRHFLAGAKLNPDCSLQPETFRLIGRLLRESVKGLRDSLLGRSEIKNILRMEMTLIRPSENNPIKFSASTDEAIRRLLMPSGKGYLRPERAVAKAFQDINTHQLAMLSAVQVTLKSFVKRFDPEHLESQLQRQNPVIAKIPLLRQIQLWRLSQQLYEDLEFEAAERFMELFGPSFAEAYDDEISRINRAEEEADREIPKYPEE